MAQGDEPEELLMDLEQVLGSAQGRRGRPLAIEVVRGLKAGDLGVIEGSPVQAQQGGLVRVTTMHHRLAQLVASGKKNTEISMLTGYDQAYVSKLRSDPTFAELIAAYSAERQQVFTDVLERMRNLGIASLDELQARLADEPEKWSKRELLDMAELMLKPTCAAADGASQGNAGVNISVSFVDAREARLAGPVLEGEVVR